MARQLEREAARYEPRLIRAITKSLLSLRSLVNTDLIAAAISGRSPDVIMSKISTLIVDDSLTPSANIIRDTITAGGKSGADAVNSA